MALDVTCTALQAIRENDAVAVVVTYKEDWEKLEAVGKGRWIIRAGVRSGRSGSGVMLGRRERVS